MKQKYTTKPIDYTGCDPIIAEHLKQGLAILCRDSYDYEAFVVGYCKGNYHPYIAEDETYYETATPIKTKTKIKKKFVKKFSEIVKWFEERNAVFYDDGCIGGVDPGWDPGMIHSCNKEPDLIYTWHPDWLEEREVED